MRFERARKLPPRAASPGTIRTAMRAETEALVEEIKQSIGLLRRHL
jgi:hypothetical protein